MKRTPPQVRESAVGLPPLSQTLQEESLEASKQKYSTYQIPTAQHIESSQFDNLSHHSDLSQVPGSELDEEEISVDKQRVTRRSRRKPYGKKSRNKGKAPVKEIPTVSSHAPDTNADLLQILKEIQDQMM